MIFDLATQAYNALRHNRRRSLLTMLGMAWGIATVVLLLAYGSGFERGLWAAFRSFGTNLVFIFPGRTEMQAGGTKAGTQVRLTVNDLDSIRTEVPLLKRVSPEAFKNCVVAYGTRSANYGVSGVYAGYGRMRKMDVTDGSFFSEADDFTHTRVAVIGADAKKKLFSGQNALGESIRLDGISYQIVGILPPPAPVSAPETIAQIERVTEDQVCEMSNWLFQPDKIALTVLGNLDGLKLGRENMVC